MSDLFVLIEQGSRFRIFSCTTVCTTSHVDFFQLKEICTDKSAVWFYFHDTMFDHFMAWFDNVPFQIGVTLIF